MTREILFRGKRTDNDEGEFVYGIPIEGEPLLGMGKRTYIITKPGVQWVDGVYMTYDGCIEVDPDTVGQFTGLTDRNSTKIFEGDIVKYTTGLGYSHICTVTYSPPYAQFQLNFVRSGESTHFMRCSGSDCEVLGNIYDNPELLEVSKSD